MQSHSDMGDARRGFIWEGFQQAISKRNFLSPDIDPVQAETQQEEKIRSELISLYKMIDIHLNELDAIEKILAKTAQKLTLRATWAKVLVIVLGALVATREVASQLIGASSAVNIVIYTIIGLLITTAAGLEAAFKWENRSAELRTLAATCRNTKRQNTNQLSEILAIETNQDRLAALKKLLDSLGEKVGEVQEKAATLGINIVLEIKGGYKGTSDTQ